VWSHLFNEVHRKGLDDRCTCWQLWCAIRVTSWVLSHGPNKQELGSYTEKVQEGNSIGLKGCTPVTNAMDPYTRKRHHTRCMCMAMRQAAILPSLPKQLSCSCSPHKVYLWSQYTSAFGIKHEDSIISRTSAHSGVTDLCLLCTHNTYSVFWHSTTSAHCCWSGPGELQPHSAAGSADVSSEGPAEQQLLWCDSDRIRCVWGLTTPVSLT